MGNLNRLEGNRCLTAPRFLPGDVFHLLVGRPNSVSACFIDTQGLYADRLKSLEVSGQLPDARELKDNPQPTLLAVVA